jgi:hypothetical protein
MAVVTASQPAPKSVAIGAYDRVFYSGIAIAMAIIVFVGFAPCAPIIFIAAAGT